MIRSRDGVELEKRDDRSPKIAGARVERLSVERGSVRIIRRVG